MIETIEELAREIVECNQEYNEKKKELDDLVTLRENLYEKLQEMNLIIRQEMIGLKNEDSSNKPSKEASGKKVKSLPEHVLEIIENNPEGLTTKEIKNEVQSLIDNEIYSSNADDITNNVNQAIAALKKKDKIITSRNKDNKTIYSSKEFKMSEAA